MAKDILCAFGVDVDAVAGWLGSYGGEDSPDDISRGLFAGEIGAPLVIKVLEGTQGIGVVLCETATAAESVIEAFMGLKQNIMVQEYIKEAGGADIRCFVVGDKVIAAMKRQAKPGEWLRLIATPWCRSVLACW